MSKFKKILLNVLREYVKERPISYSEMTGVWSDFLLWLDYYDVANKKDADELSDRERGDRLEAMILYRDWETDRKSTRLNSSHSAKSRMPSSA